jgi:hypothetical protein
MGVCSSSSFAAQSKVKEKEKLTKGGKLHNVPRDIDDGDGVMELTLEQVNVMAQ